MEKAIAEKIAEACHNRGFEYKIREDYSGRHMYGEHTTGIVLDQSVNLTSLIICYAELFVEDGEAIFDNVDDRIESDTMGKDQIIYY